MIRIRGFQGGHTGDIDFYIDGIPMHEGGHSDAYVDFGMIMPIEIESVEIIKGPASVYYGRNSAGGTVAYQTIKRGNFTRLLLRGGSYKSYDISGLIAREHGKFSQVYAFNGYRNGGWRDNDDLNRTAISGRWNYDPTDKLSLSLNLRAYRSDWNSAGNIANYMDRKSAVDDGSGNLGGGFRNRLDGRFWANYFLTDHSQLTYYFFATDLTAERKALNLPNNKFPPFTAADGSSRYEVNAREAYGTGLAYNYQGTLGGREASVTLGVDYLHEDEDRTIYQKTGVWGTGMSKDPASRQNDANYVLKTISAFGEINYRLHEMFKVRLGLRYDNWNGRFLTRIPIGARPAGTYHAKGMDAWSPKVGLLFTPIQQLEIFANYGKAYTLPSLGSGAFFYNDKNELQSREQIELGLRAYPFEWMDIGSTFFWLTTTNDTTTDQNTGESIYAGDSLRTGLESWVKIRPLDGLTFSLDYTYQDIKYKKFTNSSRVVLDGRRMTGQNPRHITNLEVAYNKGEGFGGWIRYSWYADSMQTDLPTQQVKNRDFGFLNMQLNYRVNEHLKINLDVVNVLNKSYERYDLNTIATYAPQNPRLIYLTFDINI
jgi:outer membrane receptor protein involved in Fe transport